MGLRVPYGLARESESEAGVALFDPGARDPCGRVWPALRKSVIFIAKNRGRTLFCGVRVKSLNYKCRLYLKNVPFTADGRGAL